jgi:hypothetical protein
MLNKFVLIVSIFACFSIIGCSSNYSTEGQGFLPLDSMPKDQRLTRFNDQLGAISDEASAEKAFDEFSSYVNTRVNKESSYGKQAGLSIQTNGLKMRLAEIEAAKRSSRLSGLSAGQVGPSIDAKKIAGTINSLADGATEETVSCEGIEIIQHEVRKDLPNIAADNSTQMTPMEALVIGYVMYSGDDGSAAAGTVQLDIPQDKVEKFMEKIIE